LNGRFKVAIITAVCGDRDKIVRPSVVHNAHYRAFLPEEKRYDSGDIRPWVPLCLDRFSDDGRFANRRNAKTPKFIPFYVLDEYDYYIWVNPTHDVVVDPDVLCDEYLGDREIALFRHTDRTCAYQEAEVVRRIGYDDSANIDRQVAYYHSRGFPSHFGLFELPCFIVRNCANNGSR